MEFFKKNAEIFVPDGIDKAAALKRTTHMAIAAHQDDVEIMAMDGVVKTFMKPDAFFTAVVCTDGAGSAREGKYADFTDEDMKNIRRQEQKKAAVVGNYGALVLLDHTSKEMKDPSNENFESDLSNIFAAAKPQTVYTHNLADKHDSHCAVAVKTIKFLRSLPKSCKPQNVYGCEVWRSLDWLNDTDKTVFDLSGFDSLSAALLGVFDSQIAGGKRYDLATEGRRKANATYYASHAVDNSDKLTFGLDLTPLINDNSDITDYICSYIDKFKKDVIDRLKNLM